MSAKPIQTYDGPGHAYGPGLHISYSGETLVMHIMGRRFRFCETNFMGGPWPEPVDEKDNPITVIGGPFWAGYQAWVNEGRKVRSGLAIFDKKAAKRIYETPTVLTELPNRTITLKAKAS